MNFKLVDGRVISDRTIECRSCLVGNLKRTHTAIAYGFAYFKCDHCGREETRTI